MLKKEEEQIHNRKIFILFCAVIALWLLVIVEQFSCKRDLQVFKNSEMNLEENFLNCSGEEEVEVYEGMGEFAIENKQFPKAIGKYWRSQLREKWPEEHWKIRDCLKQGKNKTGCYIENGKKTISGKINFYSIENSGKSYFHLVIKNKKDKESVYLLGREWEDYLLRQNIKNCQGYFYKSFCFVQELENQKEERERLVKQYDSLFKLKNIMHCKTEDMENFYGYTELLDRKGEKINFQIAFMREDKKKTRVYLAIPFLNIS